MAASYNCPLIAKKAVLALESVLKMFHELFRQASAYVSRAIGSFWSFVLVLVIIVGTGFFFQFSSAWKTNVGLSISIVTLLMVLLLQKTQNHDDKATHLKLDELVRAVEGARNEVVSAENKAEKDIDELKESIIDEIEELLDD
jgi:low affinity Fe/Cu permease